MPYTGTPNAGPPEGRGARNPRQIAARAARSPASAPWARRNPKSIRGLSRRDEHGTRRFRGDDRLEVQEVHEPWSRRAEPRRGGPSPAGSARRGRRSCPPAWRRRRREAERRKVIDEGRIESARSPHPVELLGVETESLEVLDEPARDPPPSGSRVRTVACARTARRPPTPPCRRGIAYSMVSW